MADPASSPHHQIDYLEISVTDVGEAKQFYSAAFGWTFEDFGPDYASFHDGRLGGGVRKVTEVVRGGPLVIIYSDNLEETEEKVRSAGGRIGERHEFPGGRRFHFTDPSGNELAVWTDH